MLPVVLDARQDANFIGLASAVARAHAKLFPDEPHRDPRTLHVIALALSELIPFYWSETREQLTEPELQAQRFTADAMARLVVSRRRFDAALDTMQVTSLDQARASLTLRQSPRPANAR